jgi:TolB-like protein/Tfp pilus assembly protein PilF
MSATSSSPQILRFDVFELDVRAGELRKRGKKLKLQGQPVQVLGALLKRAGGLVTLEELRAQIWASDTHVDFDHSLHNAIARLRETLGDSAESPRYIETLPRRGYRFVAKVDVVAPGVSSSSSLGGSTAAERIYAIAVLPLEDHSGDREHEYFADGMTEALITSLAKIKALRVISRTSAMQYKRARKPLPQIARELSVDAVIEGSVLRSGDRIRVAAQLIHATTDQHLWAESYERDFRDILSLQSEIALRVANEVSVILTPEEQSRLGEARRVNPKAHECYLKGRYFWNKRTQESVRKALSNFQQAIDIDPTYAQAYAGIADSYNILGYYNAQPPKEAYPRAKAAALKALELDNSLAESHAALGVMKRDFEWDWSGAEDEFRRAIELNPGYVEAHHWRSTLLSMLGNHENAVREKTKALAMDPLSVVVRTDLGRMLYFSRDYDRAVAHYHAALEMDPNFLFAHLWLAQAYEQKGMFDAAIAALQAAMRISTDSTYALSRLGHGYALAGKRKEARSILKDIEVSAASRYVSSYDIALVPLALGETDKVFAWFQRALEERSLWLGYLNVEPQLDGLRADPRFQRLLQAVGLD